MKTTFTVFFGENILHEKFAYQEVFAKALIEGGGGGNRRAYICAR